MTGTGKLTFGGININNPPYNAHLAAETKYWFLDGFDSTQFTVDPQRLVSTKPYLKQWLISTVLRVEAPDKKRSTMLASLAALARLLDPTQGEKRLIFAEFPNSYFMAKGQHFTLANETLAHYIVEIDVDFACTGPAYSMDETIERETIVGSPYGFTLMGRGDAQSLPKYRFISGGVYNGDVTIARIGKDAFGHDVIVEQVTWNGSLATGTTLDFIMDPEHGTPYSIFKDGALSIATVTGPAWPHIAPGENQFEFMGPQSGTLEIRWRDRWYVGQISVGIPTSIDLMVDKSNPSIGEPVTFTVNLSAEGVPIAMPVTVYHYLSGVKSQDKAGTTNEYGQLTFTQTFQSLGSRQYYAEFAGDSAYESCISEAVTINLSVLTQLTLYASPNPADIDETVTFTGSLKYWNAATNAWASGSLVAGKSVRIWHQIMDMYGSIGPVYTDTTATTDATGGFDLTRNITPAGRRLYYAQFTAISGYGGSISTVLNVDITPHTRLTLTANDPTPAINQTITLSGAMQWWNPATNAWTDGTTVAGLALQVGHYFDGDRYDDDPATTDSGGNFNTTAVFGSAGERQYYVRRSPTTTLQGCQSPTLFIEVG